MPPHALPQPRHQLLIDALTRLSGVTRNHFKPFCFCLRLAPPLQRVTHEGFGPPLFEFQALQTQVFVRRLVMESDEIGQRIGGHRREFGWLQLDLEDFAL